MSKILGGNVLDIKDTLSAAIVKAAQEAIADGVFSGRRFAGHCT